MGDGNPATSATLTLVDGVTVDREGNVYLSHRSKNRIRKVTLDGITTIAGNGTAGYSGDGGPALDVALNFPAGLALDGENNLYIADRNNHRVRKVSPDGIITTVAGTGVADFGGDEGPALESQLYLPLDAEVGSKGDLYISDRSNNRIRKIDGYGVITTFMGTGDTEFNGDNEIAPETSLYLPFALAIYPDNKLVVVDRLHFRVRSVVERLYRENGFR